MVLIVDQVAAVSNSQVEIAIVVHISPSQADGIVAGGRLPGRSVLQHAPIVQVYLVQALDVAGRQIEIAITIHIPPGNTVGIRIRRPVHLRQRRQRVADGWCEGKRFRENRCTYLRLGECGKCAKHPPCDNAPQYQTQPQMKTFHCNLLITSQPLG
ncbi:MAG: hypothetical protein BWY63_00004 [Chloroflexi bacterium ADurb.Bin360]|nr:MAG: hypothetical protein BWY63_00004 [Chloroflexi bacterium ADurb.Bin360]